MPSAKSGGARQVERKHRARNALRPKNWADRQRAAFRKATRGKHGTELAVAISEHAAKWAGDDPGMPPEYLREQQIRASQVLAKTADPLAQIRQLSDELRAAHAVIESLEAKLRAARPAPRDPSGDKAPSLQ